MTERAVAAEGKGIAASAPVRGGLLQRKCACGNQAAGGECTSCKKERLQRASNGSGPETAPPIVHDVLRQPGQTLGRDTRSFFESSFGHDFSGVRVHTDSQAAQSAVAVNALAYTVGPHVVFSAGQYAPQTTAGKALLAHELTHVVQQRGMAQHGVQRFSEIAVEPENALEAAADAQARRIVAGGPASPAAMAPIGAPGRLQRQSRRGSSIGEVSRGEPTPPESSPAGPSRGGSSAGERRGETGRGDTGRRESTAPSPAEMRCVFVDEPGSLTGTSLLFEVNAYRLTRAQRAQLAAFVTAWQRRGASESLVVDGYASVDGPLAYNADLSCSRAKSTTGVLMDLGVPRDKVNLVAHGETTAFSASSLEANRRAVVAPGTPRPPRPRPGPARRGERPSTVCGGIDDFFRSFLLINPGPLSDAVTCGCLVANIADLIPLGLESAIPEAGIELADCLCNVLTALQEVYKRGADGGCWSVANLSLGDMAALELLAGITAVDCASMEISTALGAFIGGLLGAESGPGAAATAAAGAELGDLIGGMILDLAAMAAQNMITQGTPLPISQLQACARLVERFGGGGSGKRAPSGPRTPTPTLPGRRTPTAPTTPPTPPQGGTPARPGPVCGPDVTRPTERVVAYTRSLFGGWSRSDKDRACTALIEPPEAAFAWDILDLHRNSWILQYRCSPPGSSCPVGETVPPNPVCATWGASPPCGSSVQVGSECYYAGSANYVIWGVMTKLCSDEFGGVEYSETATRALVDLYKLGGVKGDNVSTAKAWASAGYHGWPGGGSPPSGDKSNCNPSCPTAYRGSPFRISWCPNENPYAECTSTAAAVESIIEHIL